MPSTDQEQNKSSILHSAQKQRVVGSLLLILATLALYNPITRAPFLNLDDDLYITENPNVQVGLTWHSAAWAFKTFANTNWHPVTWLSHEIDCQLFGLNPAGPHLVNVLFHAVSAVLIFLMLANITGLIGRSLMVAALFALHPINVESVAWIAERKNVLSMFFFLLALAAYGWYVKHPGFRRYMAVTVLYALALMAKPQVITFPFALLLLDYWPLRRFAGAETTEELAGDRATDRSFSSLVWEKIPWFALSAASALITMRAQAAAKHEELPLWEHLANAALAYAKYLGKAFWPAHLAPLYPHPGRTIGIAAATLSGVVIVVITVLVVIFRQRRYLFVSWFWFLGTMIPMIGLVQVGVQAMADRYAYIPLLGIFVIVCWGAADLVKFWHVPAMAPAGASVLVLLTLGFALHHQVDYWTDNFTLWRHTLDITQNNFIAEDSAGNALLAQGKTDEAMYYFRRAQVVRPADPISALNLASYDQQRGNYANAIEGYRRVLDLTNSPALLSLVYTNCGYAYYALHQDESAKQAFQAALKQQPKNAAAYQGLGLAAQRAGNGTEAEQDFERAIELQPNPEAYQFLAQVLDSAGKKQEANAARAQAERLASNLNRGAKAP